MYTDRKTLALNFSMITLDGILFFLGMIFLSLENVLPVFVKKLGGNNTAVSLVAMFGNLGTYIPAILVANFLQRLRRKKQYVLILGFIQRTFWLAAAFVSLFYAETRPGLVIAVILLAILFASLAAGVNIPAFYYYTAKTIPTEMRGKLFAARNLGSYLLGIGAGILMKFLLARFPFPRNFTLLLFIGAGVIMSTLIPLGFVREPDAKQLADYVPLRQIFRHSFQILKRSRQFRLFILGRILFMISFAAVTYISPFIVNTYGVSADELGIFAFITAATYIVVNPLIGVIADRTGHKTLFVIGSLATLVACLLCLLPIPYTISLAVFVAAAVSMSVKNVSEFTMILDYCREGEIPLYIGIVGLFVGAATPLIFLIGVLADRFGTNLVFVTCAAIALLSALLFAFVIREPRQKIQ
ncbi:MAG: MFS transporter [Spirochaetales bacterium]|nr:MFS transporter [Spirochaetales bacterium]